MHCPYGNLVVIWFFQPNQSSSPVREGGDGPGRFGCEASPLGQQRTKIHDVSIRHNSGFLRDWSNTHLLQNCPYLVNPIFLAYSTSSSTVTPSVPAQFALLVRTRNLPPLRPGNISSISNLGTAPKIVSGLTVRMFSSVVWRFGD